ncbi:hypothetical protein ASPCAL00559 [Aspergillus calidoustus]|uniref:Zn(2)-C6 fungal-type domain-containing protein n=1 Tax=Aspergillus calidoustus TaxID=454130 RepID=A0A0U5FQN5_ASPCI|nr:hypothetical protein ASPCAL00559 [Aspergillus calidoustus]
MDITTGSRPKLSKTCDQCKARKVRCVKTPYSDTAVCKYCEKRGLACHFDVKKPRVRQTARPGGEQPDSPLHEYQPPFLAAPGPDSPALNLEQLLYCPTDGETTTSTARSIQPYPQPPKVDFRPQRLYVDYLLEDRGMASRCRGGQSLLKAHDQYVGSSGIAFFSDRRIASITERLRHRKLGDIIERLANSVRDRVSRTSYPSLAPIRACDSAAAPVELPTEYQGLYIATYFQQVHPIYPILDQKALWRMPHIARSYLNFWRRLPLDQPCTGRAWELFRVALGLFPDILLLREGVLNIQAVATMAIFTQTSCCIHLTHVLTTEAARMIQLSSMSRGVVDAASAAAYQRTFWVIYILEKMLSFACGRPSVLSDADIGTPIPYAPEAVFGTFDWLQAMARFSRFLSKAYSSLFSISTTLVSPDTLHAAMDIYMGELEAWRIAVIALFRLYLNLPRGKDSEQRSTDCENALLSAASRIVELTKYIDLASSTPVWVMLSVPLSASFILFDFIVHHPAHPDTTATLSLLSAVAAYFCHLDYASGGMMPVSLLSDMASIARDYIRDSSNYSKSSPGDRTVHDKSPLAGVSQQPLDPSAHAPGGGAGAPLDDILDIANPTSGAVDGVDWSMLDSIAGGIDFMDLFTGGVEQLAILCTTGSHLIGGRTKEKKKKRRGQEAMRTGVQPSSMPILSRRYPRWVR